jgi:hypothetical protein
MENRLYECIYDIICSNATNEEKLTTLKRYKAKLVRLHAHRMDSVMLDNNAHDKIEGEEPALFHILKQLDRREARKI